MILLHFQQFILLLLKINSCEKIKPDFTFLSFILISQKSNTRSQDAHLILNPALTLFPSSAALYSSNVIRLLPPSVTNPSTFSLWFYVFMKLFDLVCIKKIKKKGKTCL